jgi:hypothetical protein
MSLKITNTKNIQSGTLKNNDKIIAHYFELNKRIEPDQMQKIIDERFKNKIGYKE